MFWAEDELAVVFAPLAAVVAVVATGPLPAAASPLVPSDVRLLVLF